MKHKIKTAVFFTFTATLMLYALTIPYETAYYCSAALKMCITSLMPSLFIYIVLSKIVAISCRGIIYEGKFSKALSKILNLPEILIPIVFFGFIGASPSGAFAVEEVYNSKLCGKRDAEKAIILSNNCSAAFILGVVGSVTHSSEITFYILISNILATITVYLLFFKGKRNVFKTDTTITTHKVKIDISKCITDSISSSAEAVIRLCGYVMFFYTISCVFSQRIAFLLENISLSKENVIIFKSIICSIFEMTTGVMNSCLITGTKGIMLLSGCVAFTGLSVILQVKGVVSKYGLSVKGFVLSKILCAFLCPVYTFL